tara:strand:+ start:5253 stop:6113 length:861 start_codon:yes stop_codon:yes gene_type:complete
LSTFVYKINYFYKKSVIFVNFRWFFERRIKYHLFPEAVYGEIEGGVGNHNNLYKKIITPQTMKRRDFLKGLGLASLALAGGLTSIASTSGCTTNGGLPSRMSPETLEKSNGESCRVLEDLTSDGIPELRGEYTFLEDEMILKLNVYKCDEKGKRVGKYPIMTSDLTWEEDKKRISIRASYDLTDHPVDVEDYLESHPLSEVIPDGKEDALIQEYQYALGERVDGKKILRELFESQKTPPEPPKWEFYLYTPESPKIPFPEPTPIPKPAPNPPSKPNRLKLPHGSLA